MIADRVIPHMMHHYLDVLYHTGCPETVRRVLLDYWGGRSQEENRLWAISDRSIRALSPFRMILISPNRSTLPSAILLEKIRIGNTGG